MALPHVVPSAPSSPCSSRPTNKLKPIAAFLALAICTGMAAAQVQPVDRVPQSFDPTPVAVLADHHPLWASSANDLGALDANQTIDNLTMVLARSPERQAAFDQLVEDQQNPASPMYHHWLTADEIGAQFGFSNNDIASIRGWLESQGLHVNWVAPSRVFITFGGSAANIGRAFGTEMHAYNVHGDQLISVSSDPRVPFALAPAIQAVRGLFTIQYRPQSRTHAENSEKPNLTVGNSAPYSYYIAPADFATIYDVPSWNPSAGSPTGTGVTIGIVAEARTDMADFNNFKSFTGSTFTNPTEIIPTAQGGVDPGPAYTAPPACETANPPTCSSAVNQAIDIQSEATLDVIRSGSIAPGANLLLITASYGGTSDGIFTDAQYLTETKPLQAQIMTISFGGCESGGGPSDVGDWSTVFEAGQAEGISIFVSSGDSGAAGCDAAFSAPPTTATAASPNALCSPPYETCVGGTEFNDTGSPSTYWSSTNSAGYGSAKSYIPEGAWNEPGSAPSALVVAGTGGGVSAYVPTPSWQTGTGVPSAKAGRYTPDVAFSAAGHDAYFGCFAAEGGSCVSSSQGVPFVGWEGTSAAAPSMAGIAALVDQKTGGAQGNMNPEIYSLAASDPSAFHDVTVSSSGVSGCSVSTPSMCNNSVAGATALTGGTAGYAVQAGYDEATGWGSLDANAFITAYPAAGTPSFTLSASPASVSVAQGGTATSTVTIAPANGFTGTVTFAATGLPSGVTASFAAGASDTEVLTLTAGASATVTTSPVTVTVNGTSGSLSATTSVAVTVTATVPPSFTLSASPASVSVAVGGTGTSTITETPVNFTGTVAYTASGMPSGVTASFAAGTASDTEVLTLTASSSATANSTPVTVTITGTSGSLSATATVALTVTAALPASFTLSAAPATLSVAVGGTGTSTITETPVNFTGTVTYAASGLPSGVTASFAAGTASDTQVLTLTASSTATASSTPATVTVTGTSGSLTATTTVALTVTPEPSFGASPGTGSATLSVNPGATTGNTATISVVGTYGFSGNVSVTCAVTTTMTGVTDTPTCSLSPASVTLSGTAAQTSTLTVNTTAATTSQNQMQKLFLPTTGGTALALMLFFITPRRRRSWLAMVALLVLFAAAGLSACGGGGGVGGGGGGGGGNSGTTTGTYTVTVSGTATSPAETAVISTVTLTVN